MLTAEQLDALTDPILDLYERYTQSVINDIARRLAGLAYARPTAAWQMQRLTESGKVYENALEELSRLTGKTDAVLREMFDKAGVKALRFDDSIYQAAGLNPLPLNLSPAMAQVLAAGLRKTQGVAQNLTMTTAASGQQAFIDAADLAYMQISTGAFDYNSAIQQAVKLVASQGLSVVNFASGRQDQLDVAMRRTVLTGVNQTVGDLQITQADEMGVDLVQTSAHVGARPSHQVWQGRVFSRSGKDTEYPSFVEATGYGTDAGLAGWNCRHSFYPFFKGISENAYSQAELDSYANKTVKYNGEEISVYDATQQQRAIERKIRYWKRQQGALKAAGLGNSDEGINASEKVAAYKGKMKDFIDQMNKQVKESGDSWKWQRQYERERISFVSSIESLQGRPLTLEQLIQVDRPLTNEELGRITNEVLNAGFSPAINSRCPKKYDGLVINGQIIKTGDNISNGYAHYAKHVLLGGEWPGGTSYNDYLKDLQRVITDPKSGIFYSNFRGEKQLSFIGILDWLQPEKHIVVNYRLSQRAWMNGYCYQFPIEELLKDLKELKWLQRIA